MANAELTCQELVELVTDYLENRLALPERLRFEEHLALCAGCGTYFHQMRSTLKALAHMPSPKLPVEIKSELMEAFRRWKDEPEL